MAGLTRLIAIALQKSAQFPHACQHTLSKLWHRHQAIAVLGMHRSGTSCLTGLLEDAGVCLGDVSKSNPHNKKGNQESHQIMALNDAVLADNGGAWDHPPEHVIWSEPHQQTLKALIKHYNSHPIWGFKDPRCLLTLQGWQSALPSLKYIGTFRHPLAVAQSLHIRQAMSIEQGLQLWQHYNEKLLYWHRQYRFKLINFDLPGPEYLQQVVTACQDLGLDVSVQQLDFYDHQLRLQQAGEGQPLPADVEQLYQQLLSRQCTF